VVTDELIRCGVTEAVLAPGSRSAPLALALHADPRIRCTCESTSARPASSPSAWASVWPPGRAGLYLGHRRG
jgi:hypothetical protein